MDSPKHAAQEERFRVRNPKRNSIGAFFCVSRSSAPGTEQGRRSDKRRPPKKRQPDNPSKIVAIARPFQDRWPPSGRPAPGDGQGKEQNKENEQPSQKFFSAIWAPRSANFVSGMFRSKPHTKIVNVGRLLIKYRAE